MPYTVLLVDDEPNVLAGLQRALRKEPYLIFSATSAEMALVVLQARTVDVVISDQDMPGMRGTDFLAKVHQEFPDTVRFMLTGKPTLEVALQAINEGAISRFFTKPCNPLELAISIKQALHQRALMLEARRLLRVTRKQAATLEHLERHHPGIAQVRRDQYGTIIAEPEDTSIEELLQEMRCAVTRSEAQLNAP